MKPQTFALQFLFVLLFLSYNYTLKAQTWSGRDDNGNKTGISVGELIYTKCTPCHHDPKKGGMVLDSSLWFTNIDTCYAQGFGITYHTSTTGYPMGHHHRMPLWKSDTTYSRFRGERILTPTEISAIATWFLSGKPLGSEPMPIPPYYSQKSQLSSISLQHKIPNYQPAASTHDDYQNFLITDYSSTDTFITKVEFIIRGATVHHAVLYKDTSDTDHIITLENDSNDIGYEPKAGGDFGDSTAFIASWTPGDGIFNLPCSFGIRLKAGQRLGVQIHYPKGASGIDSSLINIQYNTISPVREAYSGYVTGTFTNNAGVAIADQDSGLYIPPNQRKVVFRDKALPIADTISLIGVMPHMHLRGSEFKMKAAASINSSDSIPLVKIPYWDLNMQETYYYRNPVKILPNKRFFTRALYDNRSNNDILTEYNPTWHDSTVMEGVFTNDEMMVAVIIWTPYKNGDETMQMDPAQPNHVKANAGLDTYLCTNATYQLGATPVGGVTYSWTPTTALSNPNIANPTITTPWPGGGLPDSYTVRATDSKGCYATSTVSIKGSCQATKIKNLVGQTRTLNFTGSINISVIRDSVNGTGNGTTIDLSKVGTDVIVKFDNGSSSQITLTVNGNFTIKNSLNTTNGFGKAGGFRFGQNDRIVINSGCTLTIDNSYLSACTGNMWAGIVVNSGGSLIIKNNAVIADAIIAVDAASPMTGTIDLKNAKFYRNLRSVNMLNNISATSKVNGCEFRYDPAQPLMNFMLLPNCGVRPSYGVVINNHTGTQWNLGDQTNNSPNTFDGLNCGIRTLTSNVRVNKNYFKNILDYNSIGAHGGKAIYAESSAGSSGFLMYVQTNTHNQTDAAFSNCDYGVYVNTAGATVFQNKFANVKNGIYAANCATRYMLLSTNVMSQTNAGITLNVINSASSLAKSIFNNNISVNSPTLLIPNTYGIAHLEASATTIADRPDINENTITGGRYGIYLNNAYGTHITGNHITTSTASSTGNFAGIYGSGSKASLITLDTIVGNGTTYDTLSSSTAFRKSGVYLSATTDAELCNNVFSNIGYASHFLATCTGTKLKQNTFNGCKYGVVLKNNGATGAVISFQGSVSQVHGNLFNGPFSGTNHTYAFSSVGSLSRFYVPNPLDNSFPNYPSLNGNTGGTAIQRAQGSAPAWSCASFKTLPTTERDLFSKDIAEGNGHEYMEYGFEESGEWLVEKMLYEKLAEDGGLKNGSPYYETFYQEKQEESIGKISEYYTAASMLSDTLIVTDSLSLIQQIQSTITANEAIPATEKYELNTKWINNLHLNSVVRGIVQFSESDKQAILDLAVQCPYSAGDAVYTARTLYNLIDNTVLFDDEEICNALADVFKRKQEKATIGHINVLVSPNPADNAIDVVVRNYEAPLKGKLYDLLGKLTGEFDVNNYTVVDVSKIPIGIYQLTLFDKNNQILYHSKVVISR